ncbi:hypothetical protein SAMN05216229_104265 [Geopseudomonas sagittaria]|uniref:PIN domain-containing protein n=1 Tax=Geopseudomonas sagittaria TaxID=1135990 RepID=A0A1I5S9Q6_9GAMM|nr:hypothetical protein [Pseudomonas sagittaria]SFP67442.1 hypothetical protein SAMN05216229_104265 [Pseudomonas sagittaria]
MLDLLRALFGGRKVTAENNSLAVGGNVENINIIVADKEHLDKLAINIGAQPGSTTQIDVSAAFEIDEQITELREIVNAGQVKIALELLDRFYLRHAAKLNHTQQFRVKTNCAVCHFKLGRANVAANMFHEAFALCPSDAKALANKVLAYLIEGKSKEAYEFAVTKIKEDPNNEALAINGLQAARIIGGDHESFYSLIGETAKGSEYVVAAYMDYLLSQKAPGRYKLVLESLEKFPENSSLKMHAALSQLEKIVEENRLGDEIQIPISDGDALREVTKVLEDSWGKFKSSECMFDATNEADASNLLHCYVLSGDKSKTISYCKELLDNYPTNQRFVEQCVQVSLDYRNDNLFHQSIKLLSDVSLSRKYALANNINNRNWSELSKLQDYVIERFDDDTKAIAKISHCIAKAVQNNINGKIELESFITSERINSRAKTVLYILSYSCKVPQIIKIAHEYGLKNIDTNLVKEEALAFSKVAQACNDWPSMILALKTFSPPEVNCEETRAIALAYINKTPVQADAVAFFESAIKHQAKENYFTLLYGIFCYRRKDSIKAKEALTEYLSNGGNDVNAILALADIFHLNGEHESVSQMMEKIEPNRVNGEPNQLANLARLLVQYGAPQTGLELALKLYKENPKNPDVALAYANIFLFGGSRLTIEEIEVVCPGTHFKLKSQDDAIIERYVADDHFERAELGLSDQDPYLDAFINKKVGDKWSQPTFQGSLEWTLVEVKNKYIYAFHHIINNYEYEYPGHGGFGVIKTVGDDIEPILEMIKQNAEKDEKILKELHSKNIPLSFISELWKRNVLDVAQIIRQNFGDIYTCVGTHQERESAQAAIRTRLDSGIVLDTYTAWVASSAVILDAITRICPRIIIPGSSIHRLQAIAENQRASIGSEMSIGWDGGNFIRTITTTEEREKWIEFFTLRVNTLKDRCKIISFALPEQLDGTTEELINILDQEALDPYLIAESEKCVLISDDGFSRQFAREAYGVNNSGWLQALLEIGLDNNAIDLEIYSSCIAELALYRHNFIALNSTTLVEIYKKDSADLESFRAAIRYIGSKNAEPSSHYNVLKEFIIKIWINDIYDTRDTAAYTLLKKSISLSHPDVKAMKATSLVLDRVIRMPESLEILNRLANLEAPRLNNFILDWLEGHFMFNQQ